MVRLTTKPGKTTKLQKNLLFLSSTPLIQLPLYDHYKQHITEYSLTLVFIGKLMAIDHTFLIEN